VLCGGACCSGTCSGSQCCPLGSSTCGGNCCPAGALRCAGRVLCAARFASRCLARPRQQH
jgi:hypothetical protein